ncbi:PPA1309 family protein [Mariniluteicoccus flavus]
MTTDPNSPNTHATQSDRDALVAALIEIERHVGRSGWDQPARLFALVRTDELLVAEPALAAHLGLRATQDGAPEGALTSIEQEDFREVGRDGDESDLPQVLSRIAWPDAVHGCAIALERSFLPPSAEREIPADPQEAAAFVAGHPERQDLRVVVGATRQRITHGVARLVTSPEDLLGGDDLAPGIASALAATLA